MQPESRDEQALEQDALLRRLLDGGQLEGTPAGIARLVLARGEGALSERQEWVFNTHVRAKYLLRVCRLCESLIPLAEVLESLGNGSLCRSCARILGQSGEKAAEGSPSE
jgi:hypothetical protein